MKLRHKVSGIVMNCSKTEFMTLNIPEEESSLVASLGNQLEKVNDCVYLGAWIATTKRNLRVRKAEAWAAIAISSKKYGSLA